MKGVYLTSLALLVIVASLIVPLQTAQACIHRMGARADSPDGSVPHLRAIVAWRDGVEDLILEQRLPSSIEEGPVAYVIPVPSVPTDYAAVSREEFDAVFSYTALERTRSKGKSIGILRGEPGGRSKALIEHEVQKVGSYTIQPLETVGEQGLAELGTWLVGNGFEPLTSESAKYYADRGWTFLAVKAELGQGDDKHRLEPLRIRFSSPRMVFPLKLLLSTNTNTTVEARVLADRSLDADSLQDLVARGFSAVTWTGATSNASRNPQLKHAEIRSDTAPPMVRALVASLAIAEQRTIHVTALERAGGKTGVLEDPEAWMEDLAFPPVQEGERLVGGPSVPPPPKHVVEREADAQLPPWQGSREAKREEPRGPWSYLLSPMNLGLAGLFFALVGVLLFRRLRPPGNSGPK